MKRISILSAGIDCPISGEYTEDIARTPCGHEFDAVQILEWINRSRSGTAACPLCRKDVTIDLLTFKKWESDVEISYSDRTSALQVISIKESAIKAMILFKNTAQIPSQYLLNLIEDYRQQPQNAFSMILLSLVPTVADAIWRVNRLALHGIKAVPFSHYRALTEEVAGGLIAGTVLWMTEANREEILSDPSSPSIVRHLYKFSFELSRIAIAIGSPLIALSNYGELDGFRPIGASLVLGGAVASQALVTTHVTKKHWRNRSSADDFLTKMTPNVIYFCFMFLLIYNLSISVFRE